MPEPSGEGTRHCEWCDEPFVPKRKNQLFCQPAHAIRARNNRRVLLTFEPRACAWCGDTFKPKRGTQRFCSLAHSQKAANSSRGNPNAKPPELADEEVIRLAEERGYLIHKPGPVVATVTKFDLSRIRGDRVRLAVVSDTHLGSKYQQPTALATFLKYAKKQKCDAILHCGDVTDGPFTRHKNPHEVWLHTWDGMVDYAAKALPDVGIPWYFISGNHDDWFLDDGGGGDVVAAICDKRKDFTYLGQTQQFMKFGGITVELAHPHSGSAYALSYNLQKHIEGMPPEEKPHVYLAGNYHKAVHLPGYRNVEGFILPAYQSRTHWMRGKRLASVVGGIILEIGTVTRGMAPSVKVEWDLERMPDDKDWPGA